MPSEIPKSDFRRHLNQNIPIRHFQTDRTVRMAACPKAIQTHTNPIPNWETAYADHPHKISPDKNRPTKFAVTKSGLQDHQPSLCRQEAAYSNPGAKITVSFPVKAACISRPNDQPPLKPIESGFKKTQYPTTLSKNSVLFPHHYSQAA